MCRSTYVLIWLLKNPLLDYEQVWKYGGSFQLFVSQNAFNAYAFNANEFNANGRL